ncbi:carboxymuconolactone decarboxylase family protein [Tropicibacter naphthalenivorans]|uniref:Alkylhydroperoxidase AhpD family core domain protein n=1 Tax=Tropicibacter naphthalenivorans TaxID=441103 RepID=A0A0P1G9S6_9RHOB|nr:carboxymuconolactone decarboxylase family protein [Tropicibacter naphthalenivorans]CUH78252.1 alkylhydroperoxidase AhpD family core domain protein [Tropicibacter naphthalenivorans]SMC78697.1 alkylhydroperoxidase AhpD family core domain-containing protein [Tropicibacter naphthalenivorans]
MSFKEKFAETRNNLRGLRKAIPDTFAGFVSLEQAASPDGALTHKEKEMIALGIAVALRCEDCIISHVGAAIRAGATREEVAEALGTAIQMSGGPGLMYASKALAAFDELSEG